MRIQGREIKNFGKTLVVAEIGMLHDGSLMLAKELALLTLEHGADAVKFQYHIADEESTPEEPFRASTSGVVQDANRYDYWKRTEFSVTQWQELKDLVEKNGGIFLCSSFSQVAGENLLAIGVDTFKISSGEAACPHVLEQFKRPPFGSTNVIVSAGMAPVSDLVAFAKERKGDTAILFCDSNYPTSNSKEVLEELEASLGRDFGPAVGISDHSGLVSVGLHAISLGAAILEVHFSPIRAMGGLDRHVCLYPSDLLTLSTHSYGVRDFRGVEETLTEVHEETTLSLEETFTKSLALKKDTEGGKRIEPSMLTWKKPGNGFRDVNTLVGRTLANDTSSSTILREFHLQPKEVYND